MSTVTTEVKPVENNLQQNVEAQPVQQATQQSQPASAEPESEKEINWRKFKEARAKEREEAAKMAERAKEKEAETEALKAALAAVVNKPNNYQSDRQYDNQNEKEETDEQRINRLIEEGISKREAAYQKQRQEQEAASYPQRLKQTHSDFDQVCSSGNLDYLEYHHPELAKVLGSQPQSFEKWNDIYNAIKRYVPNTDTRKDQAKAQNNLAKPQSLSSPGVTTGGNAMPSARLDEQRKAANWERMQKAIKGIS